MQAKTVNSKLYKNWPFSWIGAPLPDLRQNLELGFFAPNLGAREALYGAPVEAGNDCLRPQLQDGTADIPHETVVFRTQGFTFK